jgi:hypothetical protein
MEVLCQLESSEMSNRVTKILARWTTSRDCCFTYCHWLSHIYFLLHNFPNFYPDSQPSSTQLNPAPTGYQRQPSLPTSYNMSDSSILLRLPAEIRNRVYSFALSSSSPLEIVQTYNRKLILSDKETGETSQEFNDARQMEFNKLKYVNKQLCSETAHLELQYNDIAVCRRFRYDDPPALRFLTWGSTLPVPEINWINGATITLSDDYGHGRWINQSPEEERIPDSGMSIARLTAACNAFPDMVVKYYLPQLNFGFQDIMGASPVSPLAFWDWSVLIATVDACYYVAALRNYNPANHQLARLTVLSGAQIADALEWREDSGVSLEGPQAPNLRYLPHKVQRRGEVIPVLDTFLGTEESAVATRWMDEGF